MNRSEQEHWEARYAEGKPPWDTGRPSAELMRLVGEHHLAPARTIELGCGTGSNAVWLAQQGFDVTGIDISPRAIAHAEARAREAGVHVRFLVADVCDLPDLGGPFDFLFDRGCYHAVRRGAAEGVLTAMENLIRPGGLAVVLTGNAREERKPGPPTLTEETIRAELGRGFDIIALEEFRFDQDEPDGHRHLGWSVILRRK